MFNVMFLSLLFFTGIPLVAGKSSSKLIALNDGCIVTAKITFLQVYVCVFSFPKSRAIG